MFPSWDTAGWGGEGADPVLPQQEAQEGRDVGPLVLQTIPGMWYACVCVCVWVWVCQVYTSKEVDGEACLHEQRRGGCRQKGLV